MDLKQLEYIMKIAEENNITHAAEKLYITQSALNQQLLKLEKELDCELFFRSRSNWHLTEAGKIYVAAAKEILAIKKNAYNQIFDLTQRKKGTLSIGFTPNRGSAMFSTIYPAFHALYPHILIKPRELSVAAQTDLLEKHLLDIGFLTLPAQSRKPSIHYELMAQEEIYLAVPAPLDFSSSAIRNKKRRFPVLSLSMLKEQSFVFMYKESTIRSITDTLFANAGFEPTPLFETASTQTILSMIRTGLCCGLIPGCYIEENDPDITFYCLPEQPRWDILACSSKNMYLSDAAKCLIQLATDYQRSSST